MFRNIALASLATVGFGLVAAAPTQASPPPSHYQVLYCSPAWQERVFDSHWRAHRFEDLRRAQGFETQLIHHGHHFHVRYRLCDWRTYRSVPSHYSALELEGVLRGRGYQVRIAPY